MVKAAKDTSTEQKILAAAKTVFIRDGLAGARMQDIADEAGINKALLHYYFRSKEKLFEVIFAEAAGRLFPVINKIFNSEEELFVKIERFCEEYITIVMENPYLPMFVLNEIHRDPNYCLQNIFPVGQRPDPAKFLKQIEKEVKKGSIQKIHPMNLLMNLLSMCIFPFVAKPMMERIMNLEEKQFNTLMEHRKKEVARFVIESIRINTN